MNIQFAVKDEQLYVIEVNPRASPHRAVCLARPPAFPLAKLAAKVMVGHKLEDLGFTETIIPPHFSVKEAVFPWNRFPGIDIVLGPEMKSTGEVMGIDPDWGMAYAKIPDQPPSTRCPPKATSSSPSPISTRTAPSPSPAIWWTSASRSTPPAAPTPASSPKASPAPASYKLAEQARPNVIDMMKNREIHFVINTPQQPRGPRRRGPDPLHRHRPEDLPRHQPLRRRSLA